jgi:hypothetical protein
MKRQTKKQFMTLQDLLDQGLGFEQIVKIANQIVLSQEVVFAAFRLAIGGRNNNGE